MIDVKLLLKDLYIAPAVHLYPNFEEMQASRKEIGFSSLLEKKIRRTADEIFADVLSKRRALVLSEPGYGKTRLLQELNRYATKDGFKTFFIELNLYSKKTSLEEFISKQIRNQGEVEFRLTNDSRVILLLDGLDEVGQDSFKDTVTQLKSILVEYDAIRTFLSCRLFFYQKFPVFRDPGLTYITIENFDFQQVREYLDKIIDQTGKQLFSDVDIDKIIQDFREPNWRSIILIPRYLEKFVEFHLRGGFGKPSRSDLYNFFVDERLMIEDTKRGAQNRIIIRRLLEKIALIAEIYQKNDLEKDELVTVLEDIQSNVTRNFLDMDKLQILFDHSLWIDYGESIAFEDHTIQEYLASRELLRIGGQKALYDIVVDPHLNEIHPSWFNTLEFVVDQNINLLEPLIDFGTKDTEKVVESEEYHRFLTMVDTSNLSKDQKIRIFKKVISQYQNELIWVHWDIARRLASFYDNSLSKYLKTFVDGRKLGSASETARFVIEGNVAVIVGFLMRQNMLNDSEKQWWKKKLVNYAKDDNENGVLQRHALFALEGFRDKNIIREVQKAFSHPSESVRDGFIEFCRETDPDCEISLKYFIEGTKQKSIYARHGLCEITEKDALKRLLKAFIKSSKPFSLFKVPTDMICFFLGFS